jgi:hypothetical protein
MIVSVFGRPNLLSNLAFDVGNPFFEEESCFCFCPLLLLLPTLRLRVTLTCNGVTRYPLCMAFVKLDCGIVNSTIWADHDARLIFLTALLLAEPREYIAPIRQLKLREQGETGWVAPPGWYGYVPAAGSGLIARAGGIDTEAGYAALERLGQPEAESRSPEYEGRRMIRVDGGFVILNFQKYRDRDHGSAERVRRYRARKQGQQSDRKDL